MHFEWGTFSYTTHLAICLQYIDLMMELDFSTVLPDGPSFYGGSQFIRISLALLLFVMVARSCVHLFVSDGGAQRIGGVDTSVEGGNNMFYLPLDKIIEQSTATSASAAAQLTPQQLREISDQVTRELSVTEADRARLQPVPARGAR